MKPLLPLDFILAVFLGITLIARVRSIRIVPAKSALVVERLGKYVKTLEAGFHVLVPFIDKVRYKHNLKENALDVPAQDCFTLDNVKVQVDGVLYMQVVDPKLASYGIDNYRYATIQLAQTTMRSVIGKLELDKTFEERDHINAQVVQAVDEASDPWGVKVSRYEIQNISVPGPILHSMEVQMRAEREKRAAIARSQGEKESKINVSFASMQESINKSEGEKERQINEAEGRASEILAVSSATAESIKAVAAALEQSGGEDAMTLQLKEQYIGEMGKLAKENTRLILPADLSDMKSVLQRIEELLQT